LISTTLKPDPHPRATTAAAQSLPRVRADFSLRTKFYSDTLHGRDERTPARVQSDRAWRVQVFALELGFYESLPAYEVLAIALESSLNSWHSSDSPHPPHPHPNSQDC